MMMGSIKIGGKCRAINVWSDSGLISGWEKALQAGKKYAESMVRTILPTVMQSD